MAPTSCRSPLTAAGRALAASSGPLAAESQSLAEAAAELETLRAEVVRRETHKRDVLRPQLEAAAKAAAELRNRSRALRDSLELLARSRREATEQVGQLTKRQLSEIKQLTRSPPESVKRTLSAAWLILNSKRFCGQASVQFDESKDWPRCQRMLVDEGFITRILEFDPACLDDVPAVPLLVAATYLGLAVGQAASTAIGPPAGNPSQSTARAESPAGAQRRPTRPSVRSSSSSKLQAKQPLVVEVVSRACAPCGALLRWLQELVLEHVERARVQKELLVVDAELASAEKREADLECDSAEAESALSRVRSSVAERERKLEQLQREQRNAQQAAKDVARLDALSRESLSRAQPSAAPEPKPKPKAKPKAEPPEAVELEVSGTLACVEQELAQLRIDFANGMVDVLEGDPHHALILPKIANILKDHRGKLKLMIEGHCKADEPDGTDIERCLAVYQWLVEVAGCPPGLLRIKGRGTSFGMGQCAVPVPIQELVVRQGPRAAEAELARAKPGLYFGSTVADLSGEARLILAEMAKCLLADAYTVRLEGHIDKDEPPELALRRAHVVRDALLGLGVGRQQLRAESCKALHPLSRLQSAVNRRVEVHLD